MKYHRDRKMKVKKAIGLLSDCSVPIERAIAVASSSVGGTVFDVKLKEVDEQAVWRVKLLREGEQVKVYVDAGSGRIIDAKADVLLNEEHSTA